MIERRDLPEGRRAGDYLRLRPVRSKPLSVLALAAVSRVGNWTPALPPKAPASQPVRTPFTNDA